MLIIITNRGEKQVSKFAESSFKVSKFQKTSDVSTDGSKQWFLSPRMGSGCAYEGNTHLAKRG